MNNKKQHQSSNDRNKENASGVDDDNDDINKPIQFNEEDAIDKIKTKMGSKFYLFKTACGKDNSKEHELLLKAFGFRDYNETQILEIKSKINNLNLLNGM